MVEERDREPEEVDQSVSSLEEKSLYWNDAGAIIILALIQH